LARFETAIADYENPPALRNALRDADTLVFVSSDGEADRVLMHHENVIGAAADCGVGHVVALGRLDADLASPFCYARTYRYTERLLRESDCPASIARASIYSEFFMAWLTKARTSGELRLPAGDGRVSFVSRADVARSLAALAVASPANREYDITGPEALDLATLATIAGQAWGTPIAYVDVTPAEHHAEMAREGEQPWWQYAYSTMFASIREQRWAGVSDDVQLLIGERPASFLDVVAHHEAT
jgi:NAD(P)H dehydrogenase (quinone)